MTESSSTDEELLLLWRTGRLLPDGDLPLERLLRRYRDRIARWTLLMLGDPEAAADCTQEALIRIARGLDGFESRSSFVTWTYAITRRVCLTAVARTRDRGRETSIEDLTVDRPDSGRRPDEEVQAREARENLRTRIAHLLSEEEFEIMTLHHVEGLSMRAVTARLGLSNTSGARAYLTSAKRKLRRHLGRDWLAELDLYVPKEDPEDPDPGTGRATPRRSPRSTGRQT